MADEPSFICPAGLPLATLDMLRCPLGFPGCHCADDMTAWVLGDDAEPNETVRWWQEHGPF